MGGNQEWRRCKKTETKSSIRGANAIRRERAHPKTPIPIHASNNPKPLIIEKKTHKNDNPKPSSRQQQIDPTLNLGMLDIKPGRDDARFVQSAVELDDDFAGAVVVDDFEFTYVAWRGRVSMCVV